MDKEKQILVKLVQLPIPEVHDLYTQGNIPLAAGYLKGTALKENVVGAEEIEIIPRNIANYAGDTALLEWILKGNPQVVGFSNYMWNIGRNIYLAEKIKAIHPDSLVVFGGPEIQSRHWALKKDFIDAFFIGEGEGLFADFIHYIKNKKNEKRIYRQTKPLNLNRIPNPYLEKILSPRPGESLFLETMRGCPYACKYCFYSKSCDKLRFFPGSQLPELFALARENRIAEIYFMDPSFNLTPQLKEKLERVRKLNTAAISIHTEIRLEGITPQTAPIMKAAGFRSVEAGLQTVNRRSLQAIGRTWDKDKFIRGAHLLLEQDIEIKCGIILGLPYDYPEDLNNTLELIKELNIVDSMEIYPLSLIPGTRLREEAAVLDIEYMPHPPYWVLSTHAMTHKDLKYAVEFIENKLDIEFFPPIIPCFRNSHPGFIHFLDLRDKGRSADLLQALFRSPQQVGHNLTIVTTENSDFNKLAEVGLWLQQVSPFTLVQLVFDGNRIPPVKFLQQLAKNFFYPPQYFNHIHHYKADSQNMYSLRFFHMTSDLKVAESYLYQPRFCDLVLRFTPRLLEQGRDLLEEKPILVVDSPLSEKYLQELTQIYQDFENFLILDPQFQNPNSSIIF